MDEACRAARRRVRLPERRPEQDQRRGGAQRAAPGVQPPQRSIRRRVSAFASASGVAISRSLVGMTAK
jgi:hypothetical protein